MELEMPCSVPRLKFSTTCYCSCSEVEEFFQLSRHEEPLLVRVPVIFLSPPDKNSYPFWLPDFT